MLGFTLGVSEVPSFNIALQAPSFSGTDRATADEGASHVDCAKELTCYAGHVTSLPLQRILLTVPGPGLSTCLICDSIAQSCQLAATPRIGATDVARSRCGEILQQMASPAPPDTKSGNGVAAEHMHPHIHKTTT